MILSTDDEEKESIQRTDEIQLNVEQNPEIDEKRRKILDQMRESNDAIAEANDRRKKYFKDKTNSTS